MGSHLEEEKKVVRFMIGIYCNGHHGTEKQHLCAACTALEDYAMQRLDHCPWKEEKPFCSHCPHHCYRTKEQEGIREVMRYAGPRMLKYRPIMAIRHGIRSLQQNIRH